MIGAVPTTISITFESSPSPKMMNRIGRTVIGGMSEIAATKGASVARARGTIADEDAEATAINAGDRDAAAEAREARSRIRPQEQIAAALVGHRRHAPEGARDLRRATAEACRRGCRGGENGCRPHRPRRGTNGMAPRARRAHGPIFRSVALMRRGAAARRAAAVRLAAIRSSLRARPPRPSPCRWDRTAA